MKSDYSFYNALETVQIVELTLVLAVETYGTNQVCCSMDYVTVDPAASIIGWSERELEVKAVKHDK